MALLHLNFESQYLQNNTDLSIILPDRPHTTDAKDFYSSGKKYPVLWLLHGTFGDHTDWVRKSNIERYACEKNVIVVMPSVMNSNYLNWPGFGTGYNAWDYLFDELMPLVHSWFPASDKREDNFIAGLSMGGRGVFQYVAGRPELFAGAAVLSCSPNNLHELQLDPNATGDQATFNQRTRNLIQNFGGMAGYLQSPANVWDKLPELVQKGNLPRLYFCIGTEDFLYDNYKAFKEYAQQIGLAATFEETPGYAHEWAFWDLFIQKALTFFEL